MELLIEGFYQYPNFKKVVKEKSIEADKIRKKKNL